jgi:hypothetical protein
MSLTKLIALAVLVMTIAGALLWFLVVPSYIQNSLSSSQNAPYTSLTLRTGINNTATVEFGDTYYTLNYYYYYPHPEGSWLTVSTFIGSNTHYRVYKGETYTDFGVEAKVSDTGWDDISNYIVILVKPVIQNYAASLNYTRLNISPGETKSIDISSGLTNETRQYAFTYTQNTSAYNLASQITIRTNTQEKTYLASEGYTIRDLNVEVRIYKVESAHMIIYVKPLY